MRARHRWLLLGVFVLAAVVIIAVLGSRRKVHPLVTISFLGYTNLPNSSVRSALFAIYTEHPTSTYLHSMWIEVEGVQGHEVHAVEMPSVMPAVQNPGGGYAWSFPVNVPLESGRWRNSWGVYHISLRGRLLFYAASHRLLPKNWVFSLMSRQTSRDLSSYVTNSSIWLTNSP